MNIFLYSLITFAILYVTVCTLKYALDFVITAMLVTTGSTLANYYAGQSAMLLILVVSPVIYVAASDLIERLKSVKRTVRSENLQASVKHHSDTGLVEATLTGEWISGKTPEMTFQQPLIGKTKSLPEPWL